MHKTNEVKLNILFSNVCLKIYTNIEGMKLYPTKHHKKRRTAEIVHKVESLFENYSLALLRAEAWTVEKPHIVSCEWSVTCRRGFHACRRMKRGLTPQSPALPLYRLGYITSMIASNYYHAYNFLLQKPWLFSATEHTQILYTNTVHK